VTAMIESAAIAARGEKKRFMTFAPNSEGRSIRPTP